MFLDVPSFKKALGKALSTIAPLLNLIPACYVWCAALASAVGGYLQTGSLEVGIMAGAMSALGSGIGIAANSIGGFGGVIVAGIGGGALSKAGGGRFSDGFLGGMAGSLAASSGIADTGNLAGDMTIGAIVGGTVAEIGGGKFANGAVSGAMAAAFGHMRAQAQKERAALTQAQKGQTKHAPHGDTSKYSQPDPDMLAVAQAKLDELNPASRMENVEFCGVICADSAGNYSPGLQDIRGNISSCAPSLAQCAAGSTAVANYHTHGQARHGYASEYYSSPADFQYDVRHSQYGFLGTPLGRLIYFDYTNPSWTAFEVGKVKTSPW